MKLLSCTLLICASAFTASAQQESLLIGPGDLLNVQVYDEPELSVHGRVTDAGDFPMSLVGNVRIVSMTPAQAANAIDQALIRSNLLNHPKATVTIEQYATQGVSVSGQVRRPGIYPIATPRNIVDVLALAGGLTELGDRKITIERTSTHERMEYLLSNDSKTALDARVLIYPGDTVVVPKVGIVYVLGDVGRPGGFPMDTNDSTITVLQAVTLAAGTAHTAVPSHARLIRKSGQGYTEIHLPLSDMQKGKVADMPLQANDII